MVSNGTVEFWSVSWWKERRPRTLWEVHGCLDSSIEIHEGKAINYKLKAMNILWFLADLGRILARNGLGHP